MADRTIRSPVFVVLLMLFIVLVVLLYAVVKLNSVAQDINDDQQPAAEARGRILDLQTQIKDCLQPTGECSKRNAQGSKNISVAIVYCAKQPEVLTKDDVIQCVTDILSPTP